VAVTTGGVVNLRKQVDMPKGIPGSSPPCSVPGCPDRVRRNDLCGRHSQRVKKDGDPGPAESLRDRAITAQNRVLVGSGQKACSKCKRVLPITSFPRGTGTSDGLRADCKNCHQAVKARYAKKHAAEISAYQATYREAHREKARVTTAKYRAENPERVRAAMANWLADPENQRVAREHRRRYKAQKKSTAAGIITPELLDGKLAYWGWRCHLAGPHCTVIPAHWDHVKPLVKGGLHCLANLRPACGTCNRRKRDRWPYPIRYRPLVQFVGDSVDLGS
jgi:5-methylcytosine-specific restriction endonuclease McrA